MLFFFPVINTFTSHVQENADNLVANCVCQLAEDTRRQVLSSPPNPYRPTPLKVPLPGPRSALGPQGLLCVRWPSRVVTVAVPAMAALLLVVAAVLLSNSACALGELPAVAVPEAGVSSSNQKQ